MRFATFLLDDWLNHYKYADPPIEFDLASSTGPVWTLRELLELDPSYSLEELLDTQLVYMRVEGTKALCQCVAEMEGVQPEDVQVTTGAAEALLLLFTLAAEPDANVLVPSLGFPSFYEIPRGPLSAMKSLPRSTISPPSAESSSSATRSTTRSTTGAPPPPPRGCRTPSSSAIFQKPCVSRVCASAGSWTATIGASNNTARRTLISPFPALPWASRWPRLPSATAKRFLSASES